MALPSSGVISFNDVRVETSQSIMTDYRFGGWAAGEYIYLEYNSQQYAPINLLSSGSRFSQSSPLNTPLSMSKWYSYDHNAYIGLNTTTSLYQHNSYDCYPSSMVVIDAGTSNTTMSINISGSATDPYGLGCWVLCYGKPWTSIGTGFGIGIGFGVQGIPYSVTIIDSGSATLDVNKSITYNYVYNSTSGSKLYFVLYGDPCYSP